MNIYKQVIFGEFDGTMLDKFYMCKNNTQHRSCSDCKEELCGIDCYWKVFGNSTGCVDKRKSNEQYILYGALYHIQLDTFVY